MGDRIPILDPLIIYLLTTSFNASSLVCSLTPRRFKLTINAVTVSISLKFIPLASPFLRGTGGGAQIALNLDAIPDQYKRESMTDNQKTPSMGQSA